MSAVSILISDPSPALQTFLQKQLAQYGFDAAAIKTTGNPQAAAEMAASIKPDFLITDWFVKEDLTGIDLFHRVVQHNPQCRLALMAQGASATQEQQALEAGALFLLAKPFTVDTAREHLAKALEQLAKTHPQIALRMAARAQAAEPARATIRPQLPILPHYKPGDRVLYRDRVEVVQHVILRRGEMVVQLQGVTGLVELKQVQSR
jgi:two-component system chemotaxis response regulator CheY